MSKVIVFTTNKTTYLLDSNILLKVLIHFSLFSATFWTKYSTADWSCTAWNENVDHQQKRKQEKVLINSKPDKTQIKLSLWHNNNVSIQWLKDFFLSITKCFCFINILHSSTVVSKYVFTLPVDTDKRDAKVYAHTCVHTHTYSQAYAHTVLSGSSKEVSTEKIRNIFPSEVGRKYCFFQSSVRGM